MIIKLIGSIDEDMLKFFIKCVNILVNSKKQKKIQVLIHSGGGEALVGIAIVEYMRLFQEQGVKFETVALGDCSSAATIILASGDTRKITKESWVMVHEDSGEVSGSVSEMEVEVRQKRRLEDQWVRIFQEKTGLTASFWQDKNKNTTYLSASQCYGNGVVDEII